MIRSKRFLGAIVAIMLLSIMLAGCGEEEGASAAAESKDGGGERVIKVGHVTSDTHILHLSAEKFKEVVEEKSDGKMVVDIYPQQQLGTEADMMEQMKSGSLDMVWSTIANLTTKSNALNAWNMPYLIEGLDDLREMVDTDVAMEILGSLGENEGSHPIGYITIDNRHIFSLKPIKTLEDLKGLKVRIPPGKSTSDFYEAIGASPTPVSMADVYNAFQTGVIDAGDVDIDAVISNRYYEVGKNVTLTGHHDWVIAQLFSQKVWDEMSDEEKAIIEEAAKASTDYSYELTTKMHEEFIEKAKAEGVEFHEFEDMDEIKEIAKEIQEKYSKEEPLIKEFIEEVNKIKNK